MSIETALWFLPGLVIGLTIHEAAHAISAKWLGDRTAERMGRISLNPFKHLSPLGTLMLFFLGFGWGKPVMVNLYNFKKPKFHYLLTSLAGPAANLMISGIMWGLLHLPLSPFWRHAFLYVGVINLILAAVNLLPVPPLDGSKIWPCLIPGMRPTISRRWSMVWLVVLIVAMETGAVSRVIEPVLDLGMTFVPDPYTHMALPEGFPEIITAPAKSTFNLYWAYPPDTTDPNAYAALFVCKEPHPGANTLGTLRDRFSQAGWRRLEYLLTDPNSPASRQWTLSEADGYKRYTWSEHWADDRDQAIIVDLAYDEDLQRDARTPLEVTLWFLEESRTRENLRLYRRFHPEEFVDSGK